MGTHDLDMIMVMIIVLVRDEMYPLLMKVLFAKDNPFISISTYFLSNSYMYTCNSISGEVFMLLIVI